MPTLGWIGKDKVINHHMDVPYRVLSRVYSYDLNDQHSEDNGSENKIIHDDNLEALKSLLLEYMGRIKCIYIDPPYNTGNEGWVYNDNVNDSKIRKWLGEVVGKEGEDLSRYDKLICMMYPRLRLLYKLVANDGAVFISIDDNEICNYREQKRWIPNIKIQIMISPYGVPIMLMHQGQQHIRGWYMQYSIHLQGRCYKIELEKIFEIHIEMYAMMGGYKMDKSKTDAIKSLYCQRDKFILIGLTGRTGSGCTTVSEILAKKSMSELDLQSYKTCDYNNADERKYSVIYRYMKEGKKWKEFTVIEASSIIFSFVLEGTYGRVFDFIDLIAQKGEIKDIEKLKRKMVVALHNDVTDEEKVNLDGFREKIIDDKIESILKNNAFDKKKLEAYDKENADELKIKIEYCIKVCKEKKNKFRDVIKYSTIEENALGDSEKKIFNLYTYFMQCIGNNIRSSGCYDNNSEIAGKEVTVADRINLLVKAINRYEEISSDGDEKSRICIDALRNSVEIQYFRDRYRAFYAFAVNTENEHRQNRLELNRRELLSLDEIEYPHDNSVFYHQNIQACLEIADVYLYNPNVQNHKYFELSEQILKYIALILQPGLIAPTHIERCMQLAFNAKYNSGCLSRQVGAVVTGKDFSVRAVGWNDVPKGQVPCNLRCVEDYCRNKDEETFSQYELDNELFDEAMQKIEAVLEDQEIKAKKAGKCYAYCFKDIYNGLTNQKNQVYTRALHAEENAFLQISKYGGAKILGGKLFTTASPCELCSKKAYQLGIEEIYYIDPYPGISKSHILTFGKSNNPRMILFKGAIGNAYISLYAPRMPFKDEIELTTGVSARTISQEIYNKHKDDK